MTDNRASLSALLVLFLAAGAAQAKPPVDKIPRSVSLPATYPESWVFMHDLDYFNMVNGKLVVLDVAAEHSQHKGAFQASQLANFAESKRRSELYVVETVYSRGTYGERTDLITIHDKVNLAVTAEIKLPVGKRVLMVPHKASVQLTGDEKFLLVVNFTPAASVSVVDTDQRRVVAEVPTPGCSLAYVSGPRGFFSLCANGTLVGFTLDDRGQAKDEYMSEPFNDLDDDVLTVHPTTIGGTTYLASFKGHIRPIDTSANKPRVLPAWPLVMSEDAQAWEPATRNQTLTSDAAGRLYVLMSRKAAAGEKTGASEAWVFDVKQKRRLKRIALKEECSAIEVTRGSNPWLVALNEKGVDVYEAGSGKFVRTIGGWISWTPMLLHASK